MSGEASGGPQPQDYYSEGELHIFKKLKEQLAPVKLEVRRRSVRTRSSQTETRRNGRTPLT